MDSILHLLLYLEFSKADNPSNRLSGKAPDPDMFISIV